MPPSKSPAQALLEKADKKANSSTGWFSSSSTKFEEAGDLYQQAANSFKLEKLFREAGMHFPRRLSAEKNATRQMMPLMLDTVYVRARLNHE